MCTVYVGQVLSGTFDPGDDAILSTSHHTAGYRLLCVSAQTAKKAAAKIGREQAPILQTIGENAARIKKEQAETATRRITAASCFGTIA